MQRGLRMISTSDELWKEYFKLELSYVNKIRARRAIISLNPTKEKKEEVEMEPNNMDDSMIEENNDYSQLDNDIIPIIPIIIDEKSNSNHNNNNNNNDDDDDNDDDNDDDDNDDDDNDDDNNNDDNDDDNDNDDNDNDDNDDDNNGTINKLMQGIIVKIVFSNAIKAIPNDLSFRKEFIDICRQYPDTLSIVDYIYQSIAKDFRNDIEARSFFVERHIFGLDVNSLEYITAIKKTVEEYRESVEELDSKELLYLFTEFLRRSMHKSPQETLQNYLARLLSKTYARAFHINMASSQMLCEWIDWILAGNESEESKFEQIQETILKATELFPHSTDLWLRRINFSKNIQDNPLEQVYELALNHNPTSQDLWNSYVTWILYKWEINEFKNKKMEAIFLNAVSKVASMQLNEETANIKDLIVIQYINWSHAIGGLEKTRQVYKDLLSKLIPSLAFYQACIIIEKQDAGIPNSKNTNFQIPKDVKVHLEWLYGQACQFQKASIELWMDYIQYIIIIEDENRAAVLYEQALEVVSDPEELKRRFRELTLSSQSEE
ncbi:hypothetical protein Glove_97g100 [Diversispora epigaea]|uniref:U3 small nucleolar RNA-associated protein 6 homolog C-terminal domain-containing protein n=1 Tax=Diversispora epigaea TaxID=1348612 RepID=A0A397J5I4_9GLOM|nr:hypothetical protein Glove_97g100 [Diversispora epigaea]